MRRILRPHQCKGVIHGLHVRHPALFWKMRLGKTLTCIRTCRIYLNSPFKLVVAPNPALASWCEDLDNEDQLYVLLEGPRNKRLKLLSAYWMSTQPVWFLMNKEAHMVIPEVAGYPWDVVVLDESVFISTPKNQVKVSKFFLTHFRNVKHRWALCGTPAPETPLQYFNQLQWLDYHLLPEKNYYAFRFNHFQMIGYDWAITEDGQKYLSYYLNKCAMFLNRDDVHMGGVKVHERRMIKLPPKLRTAYAQLEKEFYFEMFGKPHDTIFSTQKYLWLKRMCGGFSKELGFKSYHKCEELKNLLEGEMKNEQIVVWCEFIEEVVAVNGYFNNLGYSCDFIYGNLSRIEREKKRQAFQAGKLQLLIILTKTMHFSSKLTAAAALVYYSSPESALIREQSEDRHIDLAVDDNALIIDMPCMDTVEEDNLESLFNKEVESVRIERLVKSIQKRRFQ
jgi:hypothetical protein